MHSPEVLVDTNWVKDHLKDANVRIAEVDYDPTSNYNQGHVPNAVLFDWKKDINDPVRRDVLSQAQLEDLFHRNWNNERHDARSLWGFQQLVCGFRFLGFQVLRRERRQDHERRQKEVD